MLTSRTEEPEPAHVYVRMRIYRFLIGLMLPEAGTLFVRFPSPGASTFWSSLGSGYRSTVGLALQILPKSENRSKSINWELTMTLQERPTEGFDRIDAMRVFSLF